MTPVSKKIINLGNSVNRKSNMNLFKARKRFYKKNMLDRFLTDLSYSVPTLVVFTLYFYLKNSIESKHG